jgi:hypothetical protein
MSKRFIILNVFILYVFPQLLQSQVQRDTYYTVIDVYTDPSIDEGEEIQVVGYYTNTDYDLMIYFYGDFKKDRPFAPHTILTLTGIDPPLAANNGGYINVTGTITFEPRSAPYNPEDSLMAYLNATAITVVFPGEPPPVIPEEDKIKKEGNWQEENRIMNNRSCDPCKFAFLLSGGADAANNHAKYWENLVALYEFKVDSMGYCDSNVFVHYYDGVPRDGRIPAGRVVKADSAKIDSSFQKIASRVAACNRNGTPATFQKMITNHGEADGDICLLGDDVLKPDHLVDEQEKIIDSCCRTVYDEFIQCYGGKVVDALKSIDNANKATVYGNSNANDQCGYSPHDAVHPYLQAKINSLDTGASYPDAVVNAKLAYDQYLQTLINECHQALMEWRAPPPDPEAEEQIALWTADSIKLANAICKSRNVTIVPYTEYCQWQEFVVPPGGQLKVNFQGKANSCGNATVYKENSATGEKTKVKVWNWNHPGSYRYAEGNNQRVINGDLTGKTTFWIHNDNDTSRLTVEVLGSRPFNESASNGPLFPGFSFGGHDLSSGEFFPYPIPTYFVELIDQENLSLLSLPSILGPGYVQQFQFSFQINPADPFWTDMHLILFVNSVSSPNDLLILSPNSSIPAATVAVMEPGVYEVSLGDFTQGGDTYGTITMIPAGSLQMQLDSWGLRSVYGYPAPPTTMWLGVVSDSWNDPVNWSDGVPGPYHHAVIAPAELFNPRISTDVIVWTLTVMDGAMINTDPGTYVIVAGQN